MVTTRLDIWYKYNANGPLPSPRKQKQFEIRKCGRDEWKKFRKYHYLSSDIANACQCYGLYDNDNIIGFIGVLHQPHPINTKLKRVSRLVILPDYQGIGLGTKFLEFIANYYIQQNYDFEIITTAKNLISSLKKSNKWCLFRYNKLRPVFSENSKIDKNRKLRECPTASFIYKK